MEIQSLYIEPTSNCNQSCAMCSRNYWQNETTGDMDFALFQKVLDELPDSVVRIFFGGVGEPLVHPRIMDMVRQAKETGRRCELITNGTLLTQEISRQLLDAGIDEVWVSLDGIEDSGGLGHQDGVDTVLTNMAEYVKLRDLHRYARQKSRLGVAYVVMKSNVAQLERLIQRADSLGINDIKVTHLLPYNKEMESEILYERIRPTFTAGGTQVDLPHLDLHAGSNPVLDRLMMQGKTYNAFRDLGRPAEYCRFVEEGVVFVRWDGEVAPCMALLHDNTVYQQGHARKLRACSFGNIQKKPLESIWESAPYRELRDRVQGFDFSPCATCGACGLFGENEQDCIGAAFPACGHCLWAYGLIQCP